MKILYFDGFKPGLAAKLRQTLIAVFALYALAPKETQLLLFINIVGLGGEGGLEIQGFADASDTYFDKSFQDLTEDEYLALVAMIISPNGLNVEREPARNAERVERIKRMLSGGIQAQRIDGPLLRFGARGRDRGWAGAKDLRDEPCGLNPF